jgi:D-glycero-D-manno-heptose 1,7-bisphosphate phosphatase
MENKAAFMGRNGTIHTMPHGSFLNVANCRTLDGAISALNLLGQNHYILSVVTNEKESQPGGTDYLRIVHHVENWIRDMVYSPIFFRYCYHHHAKKCDCRLPKIGLLRALQKEHNINMAKSIMFASSKHEVNAGLAAKIGTIIRINTGKGDWNDDMGQYPLYDSLFEAVNEVISNGHSGD